MSNSLLGAYNNGNYSVLIYKDGTKIRLTVDNSLNPAFAENCDVKITDKCDGGCKMCYEGCTPQGRHGDILSAKFLDSLHPFTELAINGNDLSHPQLLPFLQKMREKDIITNMTVNQIHFENNLDILREWEDQNLIHGLGVSLRDASADFIEKVKTFPNAVIHTINGLVSKEDLDALSDNNLKLLILGYKELGRGALYYCENYAMLFAKSMWLYNHLREYFDKFDCISFDNLALDQLYIRRFLSEKDWEQFYMGDDGHHTFYIDMVEGKFAKNSIAPPEERYDIGDKTVDEMFQIILSKG